MIEPRDLDKDCVPDSAPDSGTDSGGRTWPPNPISVVGELELSLFSWKVITIRLRLVLSSIRRRFRLGTSAPPEPVSAAGNGWSAKGSEPARPVYPGSDGASGDRASPEVLAEDLREALELLDRTNRLLE
jgi:hypothetical protein